MKEHNKVLIALGVIALSSTAVPSEAEAQDAEYQRTCDWLSQQSNGYLKQYIKYYPDDPCAEVAASLLAERTQPEEGVRAPAAVGRY